MNRVLISRRHSILDDAALQEASRAHPLVQAGVDAWYVTKPMRMRIARLAGADPSANVVVVSNLRDASKVWPDAATVGANEEL